MCTLPLNNNLIQSIPKGFLKGVQNLRMLNLAFYNFEYLPNTLGDMKELRYFNFSWCAKLHALPESLVDLKELRYLVEVGLKAQNAI
jgi:hypothetical protein